MHQTLDDLFAAVAQRVPEFGGMFYGPDEQTLQVIMTDPGKLAAANSTAESLVALDVAATLYLPELPAIIENHSYFKAVSRGPVSACQKKSASKWPAAVIVIRT